MWGYSLDDKSMGNDALGCHKCMSLPCIILGALMDMDGRPSVPLSVWCLDRTTNQTRLGRLAAHLISVLFLLGTFSSQWAISWFNDKHQIHLSSAALCKALCKVKYPSQAHSLQAFVLATHSCVYGNLQSKEVHSLVQFIWKATGLKSHQRQWFPIREKSLGKTMWACQGINVYLLVAMKQETIALPCKRGKSAGANETLLSTGAKTI